LGKEAEMTTLAVEDESLTLARQRIAEYRNVGGFRNDAGHVVLRDQMKVFAAARPFNMSTLKAYARAGWEDAQLALREMVAEHLGRDCKLPPQLADYVIDEWNPNLLGKPRGPKKAAHIMRDICFVAVISEVADRCGLRPTRSRGSRAPVRRPSACAVVAAAIELELPGSRGSERALEQIWERLSPWIFRQEETLLTLAGPVPKI
jgi:hypothetical protein